MMNAEYKNISISYPAFSKIIHWITALIILGLLSIGFYMGGLDFSEDKLKLYALHKSFGLLVLALAAIRLISYLFITRPKSLPTHKKAEKILAKIVHIFLYAALFSMPLSGWVMSSAGDFSIQFFGINMPDITSKNESIFHLSKDAHEIMAFILIGIIGMHMAGAFKHHFIDRDETLARMTYKSMGFFGGIGVLIVVGLLYVAPIFLILSEGEKAPSVGIEELVQNIDTIEQVIVETDIQKWIIQDQKSGINFTATQYGQGFDGHFGGFKGDIAFDPAALDESFVNITINMASIKTGSDDRDKQAVSEEWFDVSAYPFAYFKSTSFSKSENGNYHVKGDLTLRGISHEIEFPFTLHISENDQGMNEAQVDATLSLNRLVFGIGQGQWKSVDAIGGDIDISISINALANSK